MFEIFKQKEKEPFNYPSIEMSKPSRGYYKWTALIILLAFVFIFFLIK